MAFTTLSGAAAWAISSSASRPSLAASAEVSIALTVEFHERNAPSSNGSPHTDTAGRAISDLPAFEPPTKWKKPETSPTISSSGPANARDTQKSTGALPTASAATSRFHPSSDPAVPERLSPFSGAGCRINVSLAPPAVPPSGNT